MNCPRCGRTLILSIYAICTWCKTASRGHELVSQQVERQRAIDALCPACKQPQNAPSCERREHWG